MLLFLKKKKQKDFYSWCKPGLESSRILPERLCATTEADLRVGGRFWPKFQNSDHTMQGELTRIEKPSLLEYTWPESAAHGSSLVLWEVFAERDSTRLVLTHTPTAGDNPLDFLSGWHWHLDALGPAATDGAALGLGRLARTAAGIRRVAADISKREPWDRWT
jgi:uncharacterized protein YndB with AHSA1/START domain